MSNGVYERDKKLKQVAITHWRKHLKPVRALGRLEDLAFRLVEIRQRIKPPIRKMRLLLFLGDHGVAFRGVSVLEPNDTSLLIDRIAAGGTAANIFCRHFQIELEAIDVGTRYSGKLPKCILDYRVGQGTKDISVEPAMNVSQRDLAIESGRLAVSRALADGVDLIGVGEIGIANTLVSAALTSTLLKVDPEKTVDRGTGINDEQLRIKQNIVEIALDLHRKSLIDPLSCLQLIGGFEFAGMMGAILECSESRIPVVIDGFASSVAALLAQKLSNKVGEVVLFSHVSRERGQKLIMKEINVSPLFDLEMALGEGTGAALGMNAASLSSRLMAEIDCF